MTFILFPFGHCSGILGHRHCSGRLGHGLQVYANGQTKWDNKTNEPKV